MLADAGEYLWLCWCLAMGLNQLWDTHSSTMCKSAIPRVESGWKQITFPDPFQSHKDPCLLLDIGSTHSKSLLSRSVFSRDSQYGRIQPGSGSPQAVTIGKVPSL